MDFLLSATAIAVVVSLILCLFLYGPSKMGNSREPPTVAGAWPLLGHLPLLGSSETPHKTLGAIADKYGPIFTIKLGATRAVVLSNWEMAKECFTKNDIVVSSRPKLIAIENLGYNQAMFGFAPYGPYWRELRKLVTLEVLSNHRVQLLSHVRVFEVKSSIQELFNVWSNSKNEYSFVLVELKQWFAKLSLNTILRMVIGKKYFGGEDVVDEKEADKCLTALREFMRLTGVFTVADAIPVLRRFDLGGHEKAMKDTATELDNILGEWLEEHLKSRALGEKAERNQDFMDVMISVLDGATIEEFDARTIIKATILALILGATDTSTVTLTWAISLLLRNPHALEKAKEELETHIGEEKFVSESDINKLVYLQAIVKETLRLYPALPLLVPREFTQNCILGGYHIKKGTRLITNAWKIHTDPNIWSDPLDFKPERFLTTHKEVEVKGHHFELLPFGSGRRICPGISFGLQIIYLTLANFLHSFEILNPSSESIDMSEALGLTNEKATPLEILLKPRFSSIS